MRTSYGTPRRGFRTTWALCATTLVAIFVGLETLDGRYATGHAGGLGTTLGHGGWWAIPVAVCVTLALAAVVHGARWVAEVVGRRRSRRAIVCAGAPPRVVWTTGHAEPVAPSPWLGGWSSRGPPSAAVL